MSIAKTLFVVALCLVANAQASIVTVANNNYMFSARQLCGPDLSCDSSESNRLVRMSPISLPYGTFEIVFGDANIFFGSRVNNPVAGQMILDFGSQLSGATVTSLHRVYQGLPIGANIVGSTVVVDDVGAGFYLSTTPFTVTAQAGSYFSGDIGVSYQIPTNPGQLSDIPRGYSYVYNDAILPPLQIPEPQTWALLLSGLAASTYVSRRSRS